jgi:hypothetical protein
MKENKGVIADAKAFDGNGFMRWLSGQTRAG